MGLVDRQALREELLRLLREDVEFRYAVAGLLGFEEILRRMDERDRRLEECLRAIRDLQQQVAEHSKAIRDLQQQVVEHSKAIRDLQQQVRSLQQQVIEHTKAICDLQKEMYELKDRVEGLRSAVRGLGRSLGLSFEHLAAVFLSDLLKAWGVPEEKVRVRLRAHILNLQTGERLEIDLINYDPLVIAEVTTYTTDADAEVKKLLDRVKAAEALLGRKTLYKLLFVFNAPYEVLEKLRSLCKQHGILLYYGLEVPGTTILLE